MAVNSLLSRAESIFTCSRPLYYRIQYDRMRIYYKEAIEFASTSALDYFMTSASNAVTKFNVSGSYGAISNIFGTLSTAVFLT
jgi:hypothetical protein